MHVLDSLSRLHVTFAVSAEVSRRYQPRATASKLIYQLLYLAYIKYTRRRDSKTYSFALRVGIA
jgi:hypothetical protein